MQHLETSVNQVLLGGVVAALAAQWPLSGPFDSFRFAWFSFAGSSKLTSCARLMPPDIFLPSGGGCGQKNCYPSPLTGFEPSTEVCPPIHPTQ